MGKIRLIALDVDGTLLDDQKRLPPAHREALEEAASRGILIAIASGRMTPTIEPIQDLLGVDCILIAYNGARVLGSRRERRALITHCPLPADVAGVFIEFSREREYLLNFYHEDRLYAEGGPRRLPFIEIYSRRTGARYEIVDDLSRFRKVAPTKLILLSSPEERDRFHDEFRAALRERAFITKSDPEYLEVMAPGVDKGTALDLVAKHYGIPLEEVMAVGDAENDIGMLRMAGLGVAMQNAPPHVKDAARVVTEESNNEGGVAGAIRRLAL